MASARLNSITTIKTLDAPGDVSLTETHGLLQRLANQSLALWDTPVGAVARLINVSENATFLVEAPGYSAVLRIHRENYHFRNAIQSELAWADALNSEGGITTPGIYTGTNGQGIQAGHVTGLNAPRFMVLFHFVAGDEPDATTDPARHFHELGTIAARTHVHSISWPRPAGFERLV